MKDKEKFNDSKQILDLRDTIIVGKAEFIMSTVMLDQPKIIHGKKYWFESYLVEMSGSSVTNVRIMSHYLTAYEAVTSHKLISSCIGHLINISNSKNNTIEQDGPEENEELGPEPLAIPGKMEKKKTAALDILNKAV